MDDKNDDKPACKYGIKCYRQNQEHKNRFSHQPRDQSDVDDDNSRSSPEIKKRKPSPSSSSESENNSNDHDQSDEEDDTVNETENSANGNSSKNNVAVVNVTREKQSTSSSESVGARCSEFINESFDKGPHAQRAEHQKLLDSPAEFINSKFLVKMPSDFFDFWKFCESQTKADSKPENLFNKFGINLVGPFDVLAKKFNNVGPFEPGEYLRHWRFYYDPPEFQTFLVKEKTGIHYGYWRDEPNGDCLIARNDSEKNCEFTFVADNMFGALLYFLEKDTQLSPFNRSAAVAMKKSIEDFAHQKNISLTGFPAKLKARNLKTVCKTFHKAGLAVPYNRKTDVGYRQLGESDANLKKILSQFTEAKGDKDRIIAAMDKLQPLITAANIACDESDFGSTIELGIDLFCFGLPQLHSDALQLLVTGYKMVNKPQFIAIIKAHLEKRIKDCSNLSILKSAQSSLNSK
ncbi:histone PARylation factor 1-like [Contarinia nasturtii]|uniref:histone PARylation factor 1-like n=1 Tax=Contarinia nasturtii TaxID=265458 RepID=UPI0012D489EA|nr:histone PARylation factor 1-like [Contarinia nasturtii]